MNLPQGRLRRRRVVTDLSTPLSRALDTELSGYARLEPQDALLLESDAAGIVAFDRGVPVLAYHTGTDCGGVAALTDIAVAGPYRVELYELDRSELSELRDVSAFAVDPGTAAEQLAGDVELARRIRRCAPDDHLGHGNQTDQDAVQAFLEDDERITDIQETARQEAQSRASDWGFEVE